MTAQDIHDLIQQGLPNATVEVRGDDGQHFEAVIVCSEFAGKSMIQQHRMVYGTLGDKMGGAIHALSLSTRAA